MKGKMDWVRRSILGVVGAALASLHNVVMASGTPLDGAQQGEQEGLGDIATILGGWLSGDLGLLIVVVGLIVAVIMIVARASLTPVLFVLGLAIILGWGPGIAQSILTAEVQSDALVEISSQDGQPAPAWSANASLAPEPGSLRQ